MSDSTAESVAIIGMAGRFPGAANTAQLWQNLCAGVESVSFFTDDELDASVPEKLRRDPKYVAARAIVDKPEYFDAQFFGLTPREAEVMDPQHRVLLETAWSALECAGYPPGSIEGLTGVFAGASPNSYWENNLLTRPDILQTYGRYQLGLVNDRDYLATRISYKLDLKGPSFTVSTACSTSLVAVCLAFQSLQSYECDMAIAGGVSINFPLKQGHLFQEGGIASPDGHCRTFDKNAQGTYGSNGAGMVVLKRLSDALADGDDVLAVIRGAGLNNDGADKVGFTAPSVNGQAAAIAMAQAIANVEPDTISYVEAHGTATPLGDPIEIEALRKVFGSGPEKTCAVGSIKSNFGHLDAAAGIAGLIKTTLALRHRKIPPSLNFSEPNPKINFAESPFYVNASLRDWPQGNTPRRAGVSSFGMGGTNAHVVLEESPELPRSGRTSVSKPVLLLSARSEEALRTLGGSIRDLLAETEPQELSPIAFTLQARRKHFAHRRYVVCKDVPDAVKLLDEPVPASCGASHERAANTRTVLMFPGQGCQYVGMGRTLYEREAGFRQILQDCSDISKPIIGESIVDVLYPARGNEDAAGQKLKQTLLTQPALFAIEFALARLWIRWGVEPAACIGHSIGEFVAAALAGVFSFEDAVTLVAHRARLMQSTSSGDMLSVRLPEEALRTYLGAGVELAAVNAPALCVAAGTSDAIEQLEKTLVEKQIACARLHTSHAFHCALMDPIVDEFSSIVGGTRRSDATLPFVSSTTGLRVTDEEVRDPGYWGRHLRQTVRFADGLSTLVADNHGIYLECGPRRTLGTLARQVVPRGAGARIVSSLDSGGDPSAEGISLGKAIGDAWCAGLDLDWREMYPDVPGARFLPATPFDGKPYLVSPRHRRDGVESVAATAAVAKQPALTVPRPAATTDPEAVTGAGVGVARETAIADAVCELVADLSGLPREGLQRNLTFLELGLDSLLLTQLALAIKNRFEVELSFRELMDGLPTITAVTGYLDGTLVETWPGGGADAGQSSIEGSIEGSIEVPLEVPLEVSAASSTSRPLHDTGYTALLRLQMDLIQKQLELLDRFGAGELADSAHLPGKPPRLEGASAAAQSTPSPERSGDDAMDEAKQGVVKSEFSRTPPAPGARLGRTPEGEPAWFVSDPGRPGKYLQLPVTV